MLYYTIQSAYRASRKYLERFRIDREDFSKFLPAPLINWFPNSGNEGLYGWTLWPNDGRINLNENLNTDERQKNKTDIHESGHHEWEYGTRRWTDWIADRVWELWENFYTNYGKKNVELKKA